MLLRLGWPSLEQRQEITKAIIRLKSIMLQNFPIILSGTSFFLTYYSQNYAHNFYDSCSQFTHYV